MALRRPAAPHLRPGRPGAPTAAAHASAPSPAPASAPASTPASAPASRAAGPARVLRAPSRRTLLLAGAAAAAAGGTLSAGVLLTRALGPTTSPFTDVADGAAGLEEMIWAEETGVLPAAGGTFSPGASVTRGEVAAALHRFAGTPEVPLEGMPVLIVDLDEAPEQVSALLWLHGRGALWGDAELKVHPARRATRDCAAGMLAALLRPALAAVGATWDPAAGTTDDSPAGIALPQDAAWLAAAGMAPGADAGWQGEADVTRAELAAALHRADAVIADALG
ncbi:S-layer homology domain-containing protein [Brachybacterium sp. AOP43-C2-M15]|uniref:S-layer homology domain-containing protein n=1 Tax=Brachybacterium sp. AOP43-C2-M15 TaxID=3457661 RepID=UPI0040344E58